MFIQKNILGEHSPKSLVDTMIFYNGLFFDLHSGDQHKQLSSDGTVRHLVGFRLLGQIWLFIVKTITALLSNYW